MALQLKVRQEQGLPEQAAPLPMAIGLAERLKSKPIRSIEEIEADERFREQGRRQEARRALVDRIGKRYAESKLVNFEKSSNPDIAALQLAALETVRKLQNNLRVHVEQGGNVILYGPPGTGKDHLMAALMHYAIAIHGINIRWCNGQDLAGEFRDAIDNETPESTVVRRYTEAQVLAISDPVPPRGDATNYAAQMLYRILDCRYRNGRGTWVTVNVGNAEEAASGLSAPVFDRLRDNAVSVFCNWPSYRAANKPKWLSP